MPAPDPNNASCIYQRFQRGIVHFIQGTGTESILVADYLKSMLVNQNRASGPSGRGHRAGQSVPGVLLSRCTTVDV
jgi:hypothetical protein